MTLCHKLWFSNPNIFGTQCRKPLINQTYIFWSNKSHSLKFQRFTTLESKDIGIRKAEFVALSQFLCKIFQTPWFVYRWDLNTTTSTTTSTTTTITTTSTTSMLQRVNSFVKYSKPLGLSTDGIWKFRLLSEQNKINAAGLSNDRVLSFKYLNYKESTLFTN